MSTTFRLTAGVIFLFLGVLGAILPVMPGWIFFLLAALMFFPNHPRAEKGLAKLEPRAPRLVAWLRGAGFGRPEVDLANLDVGEWVHEHTPIHIHHRRAGDPEPPPPDDPGEADETRREASGGR